MNEPERESRRPRSGPLTGKIRVLVVDDSPTMRRLLKKELSRHADIEVVGTAADAYAAREAIARVEPEVITLDLAMPRMDGLTFLEKLMRYHPLPVVVLSALTTRGSAEAMEALALGAAEVMEKRGEARSDGRHGIAAAVRRVVHARVGPQMQSRRPTEMPPAAMGSGTRRPARIIAIGASTGGPQAIEQILDALPGTMPPIAIVQHMPASFMRSFAQRLDRRGSLQAREAEEGARLEPGQVLIAPGDQHLRIESRRGALVARVSDGPRINQHRPSADVLLGSVASACGPDAIGVLLTGMGADGAAGLLEMREAGAWTIAQDEASSVVFGMPKVAIERGAAREVHGLVSIPSAIVHACRGRRVGAAS